MSIDIDHYSEMVERIINRYNKIYQDDLRQECYVSLWECKDKYNGNPKEFKYYMAVRLRGRCQNYLTRGDNRLQSEGETALDTLAWECDEYGTLTVDTLESSTNLDEQTNVDSHLESLEKKYSIRDIEVLKLTTQGYTPKDIEDLFPDLGVTNRTVLNILKQFKNDSI